MILSLLLACDTGVHTISATELDQKVQTCTFTVEFPEDYHGAERGTHVLTVEAYIDSTPRISAAWDHTLEGQTEGIGPELRRTCAGYLAEPKARTASRTP